MTTDETHPRVALGLALRRRSEEVAQAVLDAQGSGDPAAADPAPEATDMIAETCRLGTDLVGRWVATGTTMSAEESRIVAASGGAPAAGMISLIDVTKHYLAWRDHTLRVIAEESGRLDVSPSLTLEVSDVVRHACDANLVEMVRIFDAERRELQTELDAEHDKLAHMALHDPLTGLANRSLLLDRLRHALVASTRVHTAVAVLFLDLDGFKAINDRAGHDAGDRLLVAVAGRLTDIVRSSDTVGRIGGDEFVIICTGLYQAGPEAEVVADRVRNCFARPFTVDGPLRVRASVGIALATPGSSAEQVLADADRAMYRVKQHRRS